MGLREFAAEIDESGAQQANAPQGVGSVLTVRQSRERSAEAAAVEVYQQHQAAIKQAGEIPSRILKGLAAGENIAELFLQAVKGLSLLTGNKQLYTQAENDICTLYGEILHDPAAAELEAEAIRERLERLEAARQRGENVDTVERAIRAHRLKLQQIEQGRK